MRNEYVINGEIVKIKLQKKDGKQLWAIIDKSDLPIVQEMDGTWYGAYSKITKSYYVRGNTLPDENKKRKNLKIHRLIMNAVDPKIKVDHISHDTLDNRRNNLRLATNAQNQQNRQDVNESSGVLGITRHRTDKWRVRVTVDRKTINVGIFTELEDAKRALHEARKKYHPFYTG